MINKVLVAICALAVNSVDGEGFADDCSTLGGESSIAIPIASSNGESCLVLHTTKVKWSEAAASCIDMPIGGLLMLANTAQKERLKTLLETDLAIDGVDTKYELWTGLLQNPPYPSGETTAQMIANWKWQYGGLQLSVNGSSLPWFPGQPNDLGPNPGEDCAVFVYNMAEDKVGLADRACWETHNFICQYFDVDDIITKAAMAGRLF